MAWNKAFGIAHEFWNQGDSASCWERYCSDGVSPVKSDPPVHESVPVVRATHWLAWEDKKLRQLVVKYCYDWEAISEHFPSRTAEEVRKRWVNKVNPEIKHEEWTSTEDVILKSLVKTHGENWNAIAIHIKGRPVPAIRRRYFQLRDEWGKERNDSMQIDIEDEDSAMENGERLERLSRRLEFLQGIISSTEDQLQSLHEQMYHDDSVS